MAAADAFYLSCAGEVQGFEAGEINNFGWAVLTFVYIKSKIYIYDIFLEALCAVRR